MLQLCTRAVVGPMLDRVIHRAKYLPEDGHQGADTTHVYVNGDNKADENYPKHVNLARRQ